MPVLSKTAPRVAYLLIACFVAVAVSAAPIQYRANALKALPPPSAPDLPNAGPADCAPDLPPSSEQAREARIKAAAKTPLRQNAPEYRLAKAASADSARFEQSNEPRWSKDLAVVGGVLSVVGLFGLIVFASLWMTGGALAFLLLLTIGISMLTVGWVWRLFARAKRRREDGQSDSDYYFSLTGIYLLGLLGSAIAGFLALMGVSVVVISFFAAAFGAAAILGGVFLLIGFLLLLAVCSAAAAVCFVGALVSLFESLNAKDKEAGNAEI